MKTFLTIFFSALSFIASSQFFIKSSQLSSNCINSLESNGAELNTDFSGCSYDITDEVTQNVLEISEYKQKMATVVAQLEECSLLTPDVHSSNLVID